MLIGEYPIGLPPATGDSYIITTESYSMDTIVAFAGAVPIEGGFQYSLGRSIDICIQHTVTGAVLDGSAYNMDIANSRANIIKPYTMSTGLLNALSGVSLDVILRPAYESTIASESVINALVWSWAGIFDAIWRQMDGMHIALKLDHAQGTDLDAAWGQIFDIERIYGETDTSYRDRLKTRTTVLNSSGTKENCESIINSIIGETATTVTPRYPGEVDIDFSSDATMRIAAAKKSTLDIVIPQMIAAGITYNLNIPLLDYYLDLVMRGPNYSPYNAYLAINKHNIDEAYNMDIIEILHSIEVYDSDATIRDTLTSVLLMGQRLSKTKSKTYLHDAILFGIDTKSILMDIVNFKQCIAPLIMDSYFFKHDLEKTFAIDMIDYAEKRRNMKMSMMSVFQKTATLYQDVIIMLYQATVDMDILSKRGFPKRHGMLLTLVGA